MHVHIDETRAREILESVSSSKIFSMDFFGNSLRELFMAQKEF